MVMVYLVRHGVAEEGRRGMKDAERALTAEGAKKFRRVAKGLVEMVGAQEISHILTSPLLRARQTAAIVAETLADEGRELEVAIEETLASGDLRGFVKHVHALKHGRGIVAVGHEPIMGQWIGQLCFGKKGRVHVKKGAVAAIALSKGREGELMWLIQPGMGGG